MSDDRRLGWTGAATAAATQTDRHSGGGALCVWGWGGWQQESLEIDLAGVAEGTKAPRACACRCSSPGRAALSQGSRSVRSLRVIAEIGSHLALPRLGNGGFLGSHGI